MTYSYKYLWIAARKFTVYSPLLQPLPLPLPPQMMMMMMMVVIMTMMMVMMIIINFGGQKCD